MAVSRLRQMTWGIEQRLAFIEYRLFWDGSINRADLTDFFGVSTPQASADLARYTAAAPGNLHYDATAKTFVPGPGFAPRMQQPSSDDYLSDLILFASKLVSREELWPGQPPPFDVVRPVHRELPVALLRNVLSAIRERASMYVRYQSQTQPDPTWRWISPHAIAFDGYRWHARAWCHKNHEFRDFVFARILDMNGKAGPAPIDGKLDQEWHRFIALRIAANPSLSPAQRNVIERDYEMNNGELVVEQRICQASYFATLHGLRVDSSGRPQQQRILLLNHAELENASKDARSATCRLLTEQGISLSPPPSH